MIVSTGNEVTTDECFSKPISSFFVCLPYCSSLVSLGQGVEPPLTSPLLEICSYLCLCFTT